MAELYLYKILSNVKKRDVVAIYGTSKEALEIKKYIQEKRRDIKIACFVEYKSGEIQYQDGIKIIDFKELFRIKESIDTVIIARPDNVKSMTRLFEQADMNYVEISEKDMQLLAYRNFEIVKKMFENPKDKELFTVLYVSSLTGDKKLFEKYIEKNPPRDVIHKYIEFISRKNVKTIVDTGENNGYDSMVFQNELKNIEHIYCFDSLHDYVSNGIFVTKKAKELTFYKIIKFSNKITMVGNLLWDTKNSRQFLNKNLKTISLDEFRKQNNLKINFIKYDLEGLEMNVLKGCKETFKKDRPQIAIRIYQLPCRDYTEIMILLKKLLKNYTFKISLYSKKEMESVLYCIPNEIYN